MIRMSGVRVPPPPAGPVRQREHVHSRYFSADAHAAAAEPKELHDVPSANHVDLYDRTELIPFGEFEKFFTEHLAGASDRTMELAGSNA